MDADEAENNVENEHSTENKLIAEQEEERIAEQQENAAHEIVDDGDDDCMLGITRITNFDRNLLKNLPDSVIELIDQCIDLFNNDKLLQAARVLDEIRQQSKQVQGLDAVLQSRDFLGIAKMCTETKAILTLLNNDEGWTCVKSSGGIEVFHRCEAGSALHGFKVNATVKAPLQNLLALVNEVDLYSQWLPFLSRTQEVEKFHRCSKVAIVEIKLVWPFANRDLCVRGVAADNLDEESPSIMLTLKSFEQPEIASRYPPKKGVCRIDIKYGALAIWPVSTTTSRISGLLHVDPKLGMVPASLINWIATYCGYYGVKYFESKAVSLTTANPLQDPHLKRVQENRELYGFVEQRVKETLSRLPQSDEADQ